MREVEAQCLGRNVGTLLLDVLAENLAQSLVEEVRRRVVALALDTFLLVDFGSEAGSYIVRQLVGEVDGEVVLALRVEDGNLLVTVNQPTRVADLTTHFGVERRLVQDNLV